ncbi:SDR family oxidoreductase [Bacillus kwashiorkori]|uniref:SDR family oxidoreductase n=1 Tax=Bacillus kwashiorkori TaxID=1522318 RepID=UPI000785F4BA|nr:SDR family oxidoreductase [Bacillus kwashiorkori]
MEKRRLTVLITGGASGLGKQTAIEFAKRGMNIVINYRNSEERATKLVDELRKKYNIETLIVKGDVSKYQDCEQIYHDVTAKFSSVDIVIHNAGPYIQERKKMSDYDINEWEYIINGNLNSVFYLSKLFLPNMRRNHWGRIITIGFDRAETAPGWIYRSAFAAAKTALVSLTKTLSMEEAENGITVNMVSPGDITNHWKEQTIESAKQCHDRSTPIGRQGTGEDIARVISFLCDKDSDFITGSVLAVTGGKDVLNKINEAD